MKNVLYYTGGNEQLLPVINFLFKLWNPKVGLNIRQAMTISTLNFTKIHSKSSNQF